MTAGAPKLVAIHQPNFFPWLGYFVKITRSDCFIILDDSQLQKTGGSWTNRVRINVDGKARWLTAAIYRPSGEQRVCDVQFASNIPWRAKMLRTLAASYGKAPFFAESMEILEPLVSNEEPLVARYNIHAIEGLLGALKLEVPAMRCASGFASASVATERLVELVERVGGRTYLCGDGAQGYQEDRMFEAAGLQLEKLSFQHPEYPQHRQDDGFIPGLSIIDAMMNVGISGTRALVAQGQSDG